MLADLVVRPLFSCRFDRVPRPLGKLDLGDQDGFDPKVAPDLNFTTKAEATGLLRSSNVLLGRVGYETDPSGVLHQMQEPLEIVMFGLRPADIDDRSLLQARGEEAHDALPSVVVQCIERFSITTQRGLCKRIRARAKRCCSSSASSLSHRASRLMDEERRSKPA